MENPIQNADAGTLSTTNLVTRVLRTTLGKPIILVASATLIIGAGLYLNWPSIVALGLAPVVLMLAPCTLMCAVGLCGKSASRGKASGKLPSQEGQP